MNQVLVDSGALFALIDASDHYHMAAATFIRSSTSTDFCLSETVFVEAMVLTKARIGAKAAVALGERLMESTHFAIIHLTTEDWRTTWDIFSRYIDKDWSYVDCSILAIARRLRLTEVFSFDHHFDQMPEIARIPHI